MIVVLLLPAGQAIAAETSKEVTVNFASMHFVVDGVEYAPPSDQPGFFYINENNETYTYVPLRFVAAMLYKSVAWDSKALKVTVAEPDPSIDEYLSMQVIKDSTIGPVDKTKVKRTTITVNQAKVTYEFNGKTVQPDEKTPGFLYKGRIYVPLRFMYESLGYAPKWDQPTYTISAESSPEQTEYRNIVKAASVETEAIYKATASDITALALPMVSKLLNGTATDEEKMSLLEAGEKRLAEGKADLIAKIDELCAKLTEAGYSSDVAVQYLLYYEGKEKETRALVDKYLKTEEK